MAEDNKTSATAPTGVKKDEKTETRREAPAPTAATGDAVFAGENVQDGRAVKLGKVANPDFDQEDKDAAMAAGEPYTIPEFIPDPRHGKISTASGADRVTFQQSRLKVVNGHTVLTDHLKGDEELIDLQADIADNPHAAKSQWRW